MRYLSRRFVYLPKSGQLKAYVVKYNDCAKHWSDLGWMFELRRRMDLDILVSMHCCRIVLVNNDPVPTRNFSEHRRQRIHQTTKAPTITFSDDHVSLEGK